MNRDTALLDLLRCELDATNHQFTHILALKHWGYNDQAARITEVDDIDFVNSMRIVDYLVGNGIPFALDEPSYAPGTDLASILRAEQHCESRLLAALDSADNLESAAQALADAARAPRAGYAQWLHRQLRDLDQESSITQASLAVQDLVAQLITLIEQAMIHASVEWHGGRVAASDIAWLGSGAAMMHLTRLVNLFARQHAVPAASRCPVADLRHRPGETLAADRALAERCARAAQRATEDEEQTAIATCCRAIANSCHAFAEWDGSQPHPDIATTPPVFHSYEATRLRFGL